MIFQCLEFAQGRFLNGITIAQGQFIDDLKFAQGVLTTIAQG
jgi:hypothetical protein